MKFTTKHFKWVATTGLAVSLAGCGAPVSPTAAPAPTTPSISQTPVQTMNATAESTAAVTLENAATEVPTDSSTVATQAPTSAATIAATITATPTGSATATSASTVATVAVSTVAAIEAPTESATEVSRAAALQLTLSAGLDPALTTTPNIDPNIKMEVGVIDQGTDEIAPNFYFTTFDGKRFTLNDYRGKIVVLNFWASWCGPCRHETPDLITINNEYKDKGVVIAGVAVNDEAEPAATFAKSYNVNYPVGPDVNDVLARQFQIRAMPTTVIVGADGKVLLRFPGSTDQDTLQKILDKILSDSGKSGGPAA